MDILDNLIQAVSILNKTEEYLESLPNRLSEYDSIISDYEHFIENNEVSKVDLEKLYKDMKEVFNKRRQIKKDFALRDTYKNQIAKLNNISNRQFFIQNMKTTQTKLETTYKNRVLNEKDIEQLKIIETTKKRGRPRKQEVI